MQDFSRTSPAAAPRGVPGFTLVELLVSILILGVLIGLAIPSLGEARRRSVVLRCATHMRSAATTVDLYTLDFQDAFPYGGDARRNAHVGEFGDLPVGGDAGVSNGRWSLLFPDDWTGSHWNAALRCPRQARYDRGAAWRAPGSILLPMFWISSATWLDPATLHEGLKPRIRVCRASDVVFPSAKVVLFEQVGYCAVRSSDAQWAYVVGQTHDFATSVALADGSVRRMRRIDGLPAAGSMPFDRTINGVLGRDIP